MYQSHVCIAESHILLVKGPDAHAHRISVADQFVLKASKQCRWKDCSTAADARAIDRITIRLPLKSVCHPVICRSRPPCIVESRPYRPSRRRCAYIVEASMQSAILVALPTCQLCNFRSGVWKATWSRALEAQEPRFCTLSHSTDRVCNILVDYESGRNFSHVLATLFSSKFKC